MCRHVQALHVLDSHELNENDDDDDDDVANNYRKKTGKKRTKIIKKVGMGKVIQ